MTTLTRMLRSVEGTAGSGYSRADAIAAAAAGRIGEYVFNCCVEDRASYIDLNLPAWPRCMCTACGCDEPASTTDDGGCPVCDACADYAVDDDGMVHCARCGDVEIVTESCGAGSQTRHYARIIPPAMPEEVQDGRWALYWYTVGDDAHVVARFCSRSAAEQAVAAKDWPPPTDRTEYLCGYEVRELVGGEWVRA